MSVPAAAGRLTLVVDGFVDGLSMYVACLESCGIVAEPYQTGAAALARLQRPPMPDAIVFDFVLPDMSASAFCATVRQLSGPGLSPRLFVSTGWMLTEADRALLTEAGVGTVYQKPHDPLLLAAALRRR